LSVWTRLAVIKYNKRRAVIYDSNNGVWKFRLSFLQQRPANSISKFLALTFHNPQVRVEIEVQPVVQEPLRVLREMLAKTISADDDSLAQHREAGGPMNLVNEPLAFNDLVAALQRDGAI
jgi:hypothetical protein